MLAKEQQNLRRAMMTAHTKASALDEQIGGAHYKHLAIQPVEFIHKNKIGFIAGCIIKYACRFGFKGGKEDLLKIKHFVDLLIELEYPDEPE